MAAEAESTGKKHPKQQEKKKGKRTVTESREIKARKRMYLKK
jgi:hypothetical protein